MDHNFLRRLPRRADPPPLRMADAKAHRSMPDMGSAPMNDEEHDDDDDDESSTGGRGASSSHLAHAPGFSPATAQPEVTGTSRRLRRVASNPDNVRPDSAWRVAAATETSADDWVVLPSPAPDIDPSMRLMRGLHPSVHDAGDLQRWKRRTATPPPPPGGKRKRTTASCCHQCGARDTPKWRPGPDGRGTLCNVCGLLFARRARRKYMNGEDGWG